VLDADNEHQPYLLATYTGEVIHDVDFLPSDVLPSLDHDDDGLTNAEEASAGTDRFNPDSDDDGLSDGQEVALGTNPLAADSDNDGVLDGADAFPTVPLGGLTDTDGDGRPNDCNELSPSPCDGTAMISDEDDDNDGYTDAEEAVADTSPTDANDTPTTSSNLILLLPALCSGSSPPSFCSQ
jgi:hypothetical protein